MKSIKIKWVGIIIMSIVTLTGCEEININAGFTSFAVVYFINNSVLNTNLVVNYNGNPIEWGSDGKIRALEGEGRFEFYDKSTGIRVGEKTVDVRSGNPQHYIIFQPAPTIPISFLDPQEQANEEPAPDGFLKIKIVNCAITALPFEKIDVVVQGNDFVNGWQNLDVMEGIGRDLAAENYHLVETGTGMEAFRITYRNHETQEDILSAQGTRYAAGGNIEVSGMTKNVFTFYLTETNEGPVDGPDALLTRIEVDGFLYFIQPMTLFAD